MAGEKHRRKHAFTLIELLVVIAVVSILASLLLPVLSKASERARRVVCLSNMRQLGIAARVWAEDRKGNFPVVGGNSTNLIWNGRSYVGFGRIIPNELDKDGKIFFCPSASLFGKGYTNAYDNIGIKRKAAFSSYYFRGTRQGVPRNPGSRKGQVLLSDFDTRRFVISGEWVNVNHPTGKNVLLKDGSVQFVKGVLDSRAMRHGGNTPGKKDGTWYKLDNPDRIKRGTNSPPSSIAP